MQPLCKSVPQNINHRAAMWPWNSCLEQSSKRNKNICLYKELSVSVHCSMIYNSRIMETTQMSTNWWETKYGMVYPYSGMLLIFEMEISTMHAISWMNLKYIMHSKTNQTQRLHTVWFHWYEMSRMGIYRNRVGRKRWVWEWQPKGMVYFWELWRQLPIYYMQYYTTNHRITCFKWVKYMI